MMNRRIRFEAIVCCESDSFRIKSAAKQVITRLAGRFGGATWLPCVGSWAEDGNKNIEIYSGIKSETGFVILLSVCPEDESDAYDLLVIALSNAIETHGLTARYLHIEQSQVTARHFDREAQLEFAE